MHFLALLICIFVTCIVFNMDINLDKQIQVEGWTSLFWSVIILTGIVIWAL